MSDKHGSRVSSSLSRVGRAGVTRAGHRRRAVLAAAAAAAATAFLVGHPGRAGADDLTTGLIFEAAAAGYNPVTGALTPRVGPSLLLNVDAAAVPGDIPGLVENPNGSFTFGFDGLENYNFNAIVGGPGNITVLAVALPATSQGAAGSIVAGGPGTVEFRASANQEVLAAGVTSYGLSNTPLSQTSLSVIGASIPTGAGPTQFYYNGAPDGSITTSNGGGTGFSGSLSRLGARQVGTAGSTEYYSGDLSEVRVYNGILTAAQVASISTTLANTYLNANNNLYYNGNTNGSLDNATQNFYAPAVGQTAFAAGSTAPVYFQDINDADGMSFVANTSLTVQSAGFAATGGLVFNNYNVNYTFNNASGSVGITGATPVTTTGGGTVTLLGANSFTGPVTVSGGALVAANSAAFGNASSVTVNLGTLGLQGNIALPANQPITINGGGITSFNGSNTVVSNITFGPGITQTTFNSGAGALNLNGVISGSSPVVKIGAGTLSFGGANTFTGNTSIGSTAAAGGTLGLGNPTALGATGNTLFVQNASTLQIQTDAGIAAGSAYNVNIGILNLAAGFTTNVTLGRITPGATTPITHTFNNFLISGQGAIQPETLAVTPGANAPATAVDTLAMGSLTFGNTVSAYEILSPTGTNIAIGNVYPVPNVGTNNVENLFLSGTSTGNVITGVISKTAQAPSTSTGIVAISKTGTSTWTLSGSNTYNGQTTVNAGHLVAGSAAAFGTGPSVVIGFDPTASLDLNGNSMAFASLQGGSPAGGNVTLGGATLTVGSANLSTAFYGAITGTGSVVKAGTGTLALGGNSTFAGATRVTAGTVQLTPAVTPVTIQDPSFQLIRNTGGYTYNPTGTAWTFNGNSGVASVGSAFGFPGTATALPGDNQWALIQTSGTASSAAPGSTGPAQGSPGQVFQAINYPVAGNYAVSFYAEQRPGNNQHLTVYSDPGTNISSGGVTPAANWTQYTYVYPETAGSHTLDFEGQALNGSDNTAAVDDVSVYGVATSNGSGGIPATSSVIVSDGATFDVNNTVASIGSLAGTSLASVTLGSSTTGRLTVGSDGTSTTFSGTISGGGGITKVGAGTFTLGGTLAYTGLTNVSAGTVTFAAATPGGGIAVRRLPGGLLIANTGSVVLPASAASGDRTLLVTSTLATSGSGTLDLGNGDLDVKAGTLAAVNALAAQGFAGGRWNGGGLVSSKAATDTAHLTAVGVIPNTVNGTAALFTTFDGQPVAATDVLARYTYYGDTNLDGVVNAGDYTRVDAGFVGHLTGWLNGDFNYDGVVDGSDYALMDNAFNQQVGTVSPAIAVAGGGSPVASPASTLAAVPEPTTFGLAVVGSALALSSGRRRRARRA